MSTPENPALRMSDREIDDEFAKIVADKLPYLATLTPGETMRRCVVEEIADAMDDPRGVNSEEVIQDAVRMLEHAPSGNPGELVDEASAADAHILAQRAIEAALSKVSDDDATQIRRGEISVADLGGFMIDGDDHDGLPQA